MYIKRITYILFALMFSHVLKGQVSFDLKTSPDVVFSFVSVNDYVAGKTKMGALKLRVNSDRRWDMWVKATTSNWVVVDSYATGGTVPDVDLLQLAVRNSSGTSNISGFFPISDLEQYLIGSAVTDVEIGCPGVGANEAGDYISNRACFEFNVDFKIVPGIDPVSYLRPGNYRLDVLFTIVEDL